MSKPIFKRRMDLINGLPARGQTRITEILDVTIWHVNKVLNGHVNANTETNRYIIILAEQMVARGKQSQN